MLLEYFKAERLLKRYGIESVQSAYVSSPDAAIRFSKGSSIALKVLSENALHKSKAGLVRLGLKNARDIEKAFSQLSQRSKRLRLGPYKVLAQKMSEAGIEAIIGGRQDPQFGKLIMLGLGGIYVEAFRDFSLRLCPITGYDADAMIDQLRSRDVLTYHGENRKMLAGLLIKVSKMLASEKGIKELDLNPVILRRNSYSIVDLRVLAIVA